MKRIITLYCLLFVCYFLLEQFYLDRNKVEPLPAKEEPEIVDPTDPLDPPPCLLAAEALEAK